jgi:hypothetical protein
VPPGSAAIEPRAGWAGVAPAAILAALGALHVAWGTGSSWPFADRARLAAAVVGRREPDFPPARSAFAVSAALLGASAAVAGQARGPDPLRRLTRSAAAAAGAAFTARGTVGLARPALLPAGDLPPFRRLNALVYSPLCLGLGAAIARSSRRAGSPPPAAR